MNKGEMIDALVSVRHDIIDVRTDMRVNVNKREELEISYDYLEDELDDLELERDVLIEKLDVVKSNE